MRNFITTVETVALPAWAREAPILSDADLHTLDSAEFIEGDEWDDEWRLCDIPITLFPVVEKLPEATPGKMDGIRAWFASVGGDAALSERPLVALWNGSIILLDGFHRLVVARETGESTVKCSIGFPLEE